MQWTEEDNHVLDLVRNLTCPVFLSVNKIDMVKDKQQMLPYVAELGAKMHFVEIIPCVAISGQQVQILEQKVFAALPPGQFFNAEDQTTDQPLNFRLAEIIREKLTRALGAELPYAIKVEIEDVTQTTSQLVVHAIIWVERDSQKAIVIGKHG